MKFLRTKMAEKNLHLPEDLVLEILPRLPVKSLVRFKCVAKSWKAFFATPSFVAKQLSASSVNHEHNQLLMICRHEPPWSLSFELLSNGNPAPSLHKPFEERCVDQVYGPCNGIFCVEGCEFNDLRLWNPATREVKLLPPPLIPLSNKHPIPIYGFGIDPKTNDYKIVKLLFSSRLSHPDSRHPTTAEVYNLTTDSWRIITDIVPNCYVFYPTYNPYANGVYYWMALNDNVQIILCFDMSSETFRQIKVPLTLLQSNHNGDYIDNDITMINDCISCFYQYKNYNCSLFEVAVMNEYNGTEASWTKLSLMLHGERGRPGEFDVGFHSFWKDTEVILSVQTQQKFLTSYKINGSQLQPVQDIQIQFKSGELYWLREYIESIVPLGS